MHSRRTSLIIAVAAMAAVALPAAAGSAGKWSFGPQKRLPGTRPAGIGTDIGRINIIDSFIRVSRQTASRTKAFQIKGTLNVQIQKPDSFTRKFGLENADCTLTTVGGSQFALDSGGDRLVYPRSQRLVRYGNQNINVSLGLERAGLGANVRTTFKLPRYKRSAKQPQVNSDPRSDNSNRWGWDYSSVRPYVRNEQLGFTGIVLDKPPLSGGITCGVQVKQDNRAGGDERHFGSVSLRFRNIR